MKKRMLGMLSLFVFLLLVSCNNSAGGEGDANLQNTFAMTATVQNIGEKIEVDVTQAEYASGIYWVIVSDNTEFTDENGGQIALSDIHVGDTVEILYNGQVMMSYPPQIVALRIRK